jgi:NAD(P)-dependent dehydrogenase (short-subunit alcohol dehydrogenase family)
MLAAWLVPQSQQQQTGTDPSQQVMMAKYAIPEMTKNDGQWRGSIVNLASVAGIRGGNPHLLYPTSKGAVVVSDCVRQSGPFR